MTATGKHFKISPEKQAAFVQKFRAKQAADRIRLVQRWKDRIDTYRANGWDDLAECEVALLDEYLAGVGR